MNLRWRGRSPSDLAPEEPRPQGAPQLRGAVAADVGVLLLLGASIYVSLAGRALLLGVGQPVLPPARVLLFAAASLLLVRHVACPRPGILATVRRWRAALAARPHADAAVGACVATRPLVLIVGYLAVVTFGFPDEVGFRLSQDPLGNLPARYDAGWYGGIAVDGYSWSHEFGQQGNIAFFPALPMLMRAVGAALGMNTAALPRDKRMLRALWAGVIVSLLAFVWALWYLSRLSGMLAGPHAAAGAPLLLAAYPFAVFFSAPYTESLFLLGSVAVFYHVHREHWVRAAAFGLLLGLSRPNGCLVSLPLAVLALQPLFRGAQGAARRAAPGIRAAAVRLTVAATPALGMLLFTGYLYVLTDVPFAWARMQGAWGRTWGTGPISQGWQRLMNGGPAAVFQSVPVDALNTCAVLFALVLVPVVARRLGLAYATFVLVNVVPPVLAGGALSMGRVSATLFPLFVGLAASLPPRAIPAWAAGFGVLQGLVAALFFTWRDLF